MLSKNAKHISVQTMHSWTTYSIPSNPVSYELVEQSVDPSQNTVVGENNTQIYTSILPKVSPVVGPTLCLNMIVKNESRIIERLLASVAPWIDSYCICDTGSTDNTVDLIRAFFDARSIPGKIVFEPFRDFGHNRTAALQACRGMDHADFILLLDADMCFWVDPALTKPMLMQMLDCGDAIHVLQGTDDFHYQNVRIVRNRGDLSYWGVTHEYIQLPDQVRHIHIDKSLVFIRDIGDGGCKTDKFERDIRLLERGLVDCPNNARYTFYLANSYRDAGQADKAIETYRKRVALGDWIEEVWSSHYNIGLCYRAKGDMANAIFAWLEAYHCFPERVENLYQIIHYYRVNSQPKLAYPFYVLAKNELKKRRTTTYLFMHKAMYDYMIDYEMTILGYYCNTDGYDLVRLSMNVLNYPTLEDNIRRNVLSNYKFYAPAIKQWHGSTDPTTEQLLTTLRTVGRETLGILGDPDFVPSTPSIVRLSKTSYAVCIRYHNYQIDDKGNYIQRSTIASKNRLVILDQTGDTWAVRSSVWIEHDPQYDDRYVGTEDLRIRPHRDQDQEDNPIILQYNGNRYLAETSTMVVEVADFNATVGNSAPPKHLRRMDGQRSIEKNWVFVDPMANSLSQRMIYDWSPLIVGSVYDNQFVKKHEIATPPCFKQVRGSTNGQAVGLDEIWFLCHVVSYEDRRYYYHLVVVLDRTTLALKRYTTLWTFEGSKVEFTLGFVYQEETDTFLIGYSVMDCKTDYMVIPKSKFEDMMIVQG